MPNIETYKSMRQLQKCGHIKFKPGVSPQVLQTIRNIQIQKHSLGKMNMKLKPKNMQIQQQQKPNELQMNQKLIWVLSFIESVYFQEVQFFKVNAVLTSQLFMTFTQISFHQLEYLDLSILFIKFDDCGLKSIQFLTFLDLPQLKRLILDRNDLTNLNSFAKSTFPKLYQIDLIDNQIQNAKGLHRSHLGLKLGVLDVSQKKQRLNCDTFTYLSNWLFKLPFQSINYIRKRETKFLFRDIHMRKALRKYQNISFR